MRMMLLLPLLLAGCATPSHPPLAPADAARKAGATEVVATPGPDGGTILNGKVDGRAFVLAVPAQWSRETILFGQGYATPGGAPTLPADPIAKDPGGGLFRHAYGEGVALGIAAVDKTGIATESGAVNMMRLHDLLRKMGAARQYTVGGSMGGSIVMAAIDRYPQAFAGAVSMCGVTEGWRPLIAQLMDMRAAYDILTAGTPYALPGAKDITRSALPVVPPSGDSTPGDVFREAQRNRLIAPILGLFAAAAANPQGAEAKIIRQVAAVGGFPPDPAALGAPIYSAALGMDDIVATMGGLPVGNTDRRYAPPEMSEAETAAFNRQMQRYRTNPKAVEYAKRWHETDGRFRVPLVTVHQTLDSLVPFSQSQALGQITAKAGNSARLVQYAVPPTQFPLPGGLKGYAHCGFTPAQNIAAFEAMRAWVKTGKRPAPDAVQ